MSKNISYLLIYNILIIALPGSLYLAWNNVTAGIIYSLIFFAVSASIPLIIRATKGDNLPRLKRFLSVPYYSKPTVASLLYLLGWAAPVILVLVAAVIGSGFSVVSLSIPLFGQEISGAQSFSASQIEASTPWKLFNTMYTAGNMETYAYNYGAMVFGFVMGIYLFYKLGDKDRIFGFLPKSWWVAFCMLLFSLTTFVLSHVMNKTYDLKSFVIAGIFLLVTNASILWKKHLIFFWLGYHQSNNLMWIIAVLGAAVVWNGFISWFGLIFVANMLVIIFYVIKQWPLVWRDFTAWIWNRKTRGG